MILFASTTMQADHDAFSDLLFITACIFVSSLETGYYRTANRKTYKRVCSLQALNMVIRARIFRKSSMMLIVVGQFHLNNLNNKANELQVQGNTRDSYILFEGWALELRERDIFVEYPFTAQ